MEKMKGKYVLINGADTKIGRSVATLMAREGAAGLGLIDTKGSFINIISIDNVETVGVPCDVSNPNEIKAAVDKIVEKFKTVDILINCPNEQDYNHSVTNTTDEMWQRVIGINQNSVFYCCREVLRVMEKNNKGVIVNVAPLSGLSANAGASYSSAGHAIVSLSKNISIQYSGTDIRSNAILTGKASDEYASDIEFDKSFDAICKKHSDESVGEVLPEEVAKAVLFLASDDSSCISGQWICVDKGSY